MLPAPIQPWHVQTVDDVSAMAGSDSTRGLDAAEAAKRLAAHGPNVISEPPQRG